MTDTERAAIEAAQLAARPTPIRLRCRAQSVENWAE